MFLREDLDGPITELRRIVVDGTGLYGEVYLHGEWLEDDYAVQFVRYPPECGDFIGEVEATELIASGVLDGEAEAVDNRDANVRTPPGATDIPEN